MHPHYAEVAVRNFLDHVAHAPVCQALRRQEVNPSPDAHRADAPSVRTDRADEQHA